MGYNIANMVLMGILLISVPLAHADTAMEQAATSAALKWLSEIDAENYEASWNDAAQNIKNAVTKEQWVQGMQTGHKLLGKTISRKLKNSTYKTALPGAPNGNYVVIQFETSLENKTSAIETVTPMMEKDGIWRVSGYYIK